MEKTISTWQFCINASIIQQQWPLLNSTTRTILHYGVYLKDLEKYTKRFYRFIQKGKCGEFDAIINFVCLSPLTLWVKIMLKIVCRIEHGLLWQRHKLCTWSKWVINKTTIIVSELFVTYRKPKTMWESNFQVYRIIRKC